ncbi:MAG: glycosyltransferase [Nitrospirota bacterium]
MKVCYFGTYSRQEGYPMNRVIIEGLRKNNVEVIECHSNLWKDREKIEGKFNLFSIPVFILRLLYTYVCLIRKFFKIESYDILIVGYIGHFDIFLARFLNMFKGKRPIIFNALFSLYETIVIDRRFIPTNSLRGRLLWVIDKYSCYMADRVILDTNEHIYYFIKEFGLARDKFIKILVGSEQFSVTNPDGRIKKKPYTNDLFNIIFFGTYIPLHGIEYIVKAAKAVEEHEDIQFILIGSGQIYREIEELASNLDTKNILFINHWIGYEGLARYIEEADICLGIFGKSEKTDRVIPCKVFDCLSMAKPVITGRTRAIQELLKDRESVLLSEMADHKTLADAILTLKNDEALREKIAANGYQVYKENASREIIGRELARYLNTLIKE